MDGFPPGKGSRPRQSARLPLKNPVLGGRVSVEQQGTDYANQRKTSLVSGQEIWLGMGFALRLAGMGRIGGLVGVGYRGRCTAAARALWSLDRFGRGLDRCRLCSLPRQGRATTLALGKGLAIPTRSASEVRAKGTLSAALACALGWYGTMNDSRQLRAAPIQSVQNGLRSAALPLRNSFGVEGRWGPFPRVAAARQPWATLRNPFGITVASRKTRASRLRTPSDFFANPCPYRTPASPRGDGARGDERFPSRG